MSADVLLTGGTGFIGSNVAKRLAEKGYNIRFLVRDEKSRVQGEKVVGDLSSPKSCRKACEGIERVYHCAGLLGGWKVAEEELLRVNFVGTKNIFDAAAKEDVGLFVHVSSGGIFGPQKKGETANDFSAYRPINAYEKSKIKAERYVLSENRDIDVAVARPEFVYGPGDTHLLSFFRAVEKGLFVFFDGGKSLLHPTYIDDAAEGIVLVGEKRKALGNAFILAGERPVSVREFVHEIAVALNKKTPSMSIPVPLAKTAAFFCEKTLGLFSKPPLTLEQVGYLSENRAFDISRAKKLLGYKPKVSISKGIGKTVEWYEKKGLLGRKK